MSEERKKFSKCGEGEKCKCRISGVRKKKKLKERKIPRKKNQSFFWMKILLSSCSLVGFFCGKEMFLKFEEKVLGVCYPVSWAPC